MNEYVYTGITLSCMLATFAWGRFQGFERGTYVMKHIFATAMNIKQIKWDEETGQLTFIDKYGAKKDPSKAWNNDQN